MFNRKTALVTTSAVVLAPAVEAGAEQPINPAAVAGHNQPKAEPDVEALKAKALFVASKEDEDTEAAVELAYNSKAEVAVGAIRIMLALVANHGAEEMATWPEPDSDTGTNPDVFKVDSEKDGKAKKETVRWWNLYADNTPRGKSLFQRKEHLILAGKDGANKSGIPEDILDLNSVKRAEQINLVDGQITANRSDHKEAGRLFFQFAAVKSLAEVDCNPIWAEEEGGEIERTKKPIMVWRVPAEGQPVTHFRHFSVGAFMKLDVPKAQENGGTYKALMATVDRGTGSADNKTGGKEPTPAIKTVTTGTSRLVELHRWFTEIVEDKTQADYGTLLKAMKHKDADELICATVELEKMLHTMNEEAKAFVRYANIQKNKPDLVAVVGPEAKAS